MTTEEPENLYGPGMAATAALSALIGAAISVLRAKGLLDRDDAAAIFSLADSVLPPEATLISVAKLAADQVVEQIERVEVRRTR